MTKKHYYDEIERNGIGLGLTALLLVPVVWLAFSWFIGWWWGS